MDKFIPHVSGAAFIEMGGGTVTKVTPLTPPPSGGPSLPPGLVEALGGLEAWASLPVLDLGTRCGGTGYIDFIRAEEMSAPVMRGEDGHGRKFLAIRINSDFSETMGWLGVGPEPGTPVVECLFQRYANDPQTWVSGGEAPVVCSGLATPGDWRFLGRLLRGEEAGVRGSSPTPPEGARNRRPAEYPVGWVEYEYGEIRLV